MEDPKQLDRQEIQTTLSVLSSSHHTPTDHRELLFDCIEGIDALPDWNEDVAHCMLAFDQDIQDEPKIPEKGVRLLRQRLVVEEFTELMRAWVSNDLVEIADGIADLIYVLLGMAHAYGIPIEEVWDEVHRSNMSKLDEDGNAIFDEGGKFLKGPNYFKPNLKDILHPPTKGG